MSYQSPRYLFYSPGSYEVKKSDCVCYVAQQLNVETSMVVLPRQMHSSNVLRFDDQSYEALRKGEGITQQDAADAVIASRLSHDFAIGIQSADCAPILGATEHEILAIHAGWIGLRDNIIEKTLSKLKPFSKIEFFVGPCAEHNYVRPLNDSVSIPHAVVDPTSDTHGALNIKATASAQIRSYCALRSLAYTIDISPICTISDRSWLSFRRTNQECIANGIKEGFAVERQKLSLAGYAVNNFSCIAP